MMLIDRVLALIGLCRIKRDVHLHVVRTVGTPETHRAIEAAMRRVAMTAKQQRY